MFEQFGNYPEVKWSACAAAQAYTHLDKIRITPDLHNFNLVRFIDLRKQPKVNKDYRFKLLLTDNKTNIFIEGPDKLLDEIVLRLPHYVGKSWIEIKNMSLERDSLTCKNAFTSLCDPQVIKGITWEEEKPGVLSHELELDKLDKICSECKNFEFKKD